MKEDEIEKYVEAGKIAKKIRERLEEYKFLGKSYKEVCDFIERLIFELGGRPAFPVNLSIDHVAAHDTALPKDGRRVDGKLLKVDFGIHIDGYIVDNAFTIVFDKKYQKLKKASEDALKAAIDVIKPNIEVWKIGEIIEDTIKNHGFLPIYNLSGHQINRYKLHAGISIPNYNNREKTKIKEGMVLAIEPFATDGKGFVRDNGDSGIMRIEKWKLVRLSRVRLFISKIEKVYNGLPFAKRWLFEDFQKEVKEGLVNLCISLGLLYTYPKLVEVSGGVVSQAETTIIVYDPPIILV